MKENLFESRFRQQRQKLDTWVPCPRMCGLLVLWLAIAVTIFHNAEPPSSVADEIARQLAAGNAPHWKLDTVVGIYWGAAANCTIAGLLIITMRWWCRQSSAAETDPRSSVKSGRFFLLALILIVITAGAVRWKLANGSLWWDEMWNVKMATVGEFRTGSKHPESLRFHPTDFARCAWYYQKPTNHVPTALASKVSYNIWSQLTNARVGEINEFVIRLPVFLSALGSVALIGLCVRRWTGPGPGLVAAAILAVHPWFIRYGIDARAYGPVVFSMLLSLWSLSQALSTDRFRFWLLFGFAQFLLMWSNLHTIWFCASATIAAALLIGIRHSPAHRWPQMGRLLAANALAAAAFLQVFIPNLIQLSRWASSEMDDSRVDFSMLRTTASQLLFGIEPEWPIHGIESAGLVTWASETGGHTWLMWVAILAALAFIISGMLHLSKKNRVAGALILATFLAAIVFLTASWLYDFYFYPRFLIVLLPSVVITLATGLWQGCQWIHCRLSLARPGAIAALGFFGYLLICLPQISVLQKRSYAPMREVAQYILAQKKLDPEVQAFGYGLGSRILRLYDPEIRYTITPPGEKDLRSALEEAKKNQHPLYVFYGYPLFNRMTMPGGFPMLEDPDLFEEVAAFGGIEPEFYFRILKAKEQAWNK
ncbi:MAG: hypothetical protein ACI9R3_003487 [Verrucomicrobiales bacterium]|jgi:hypothetical protein